jgi:hypothetical protein
MAKTKMYADETQRSHIYSVSPVASFYFPSLCTPENGKNENEEVDTLSEWEKSIRWISKSQITNIKSKVLCLANLERLKNEKHFMRNVFWFRLIKLVTTLLL